MSAERQMAGGIVAMSLANGGSLAGFALTAWVLGADRALDAGTWRESDAFAVCVVLGTAAASALAGAVCHLIARRRGTVVVVAVLLVSWWSAENAVRLTVGPGDVCARHGDECSFIDAARLDLLREPCWSCVASPLVVGGGVVLGAGVMRRVHRVEAPGG